jgi:putative radical SAM enzyme (TIGR03279 family)
VIRVQSVAPQSLGAELGLDAGWTLHSVNGRELGDFLDWEYLTADERFVLLAESPEGQAVEFDIERPEGLALGVTLEPPRVRRCGNRCDFCFVDGLPAGLRDALYVRDDDYRLSFRYGNFATLTNLKSKDIERIVEYRLSPLYVSVHATEPIVRRRLLRHPRAPAIVPQLRAFGARGIRFHTQIVIQPGLNDGPVLERSLDDLWTLGTTVLSVSVVPVGLTEFSKHHLVRAPTADECRAIIDLIERWQVRALSRHGRRWVYGSDDLYLGAGSPLPPSAAYDGFEQVENGVGSVRFLQTRIEAALDRLPDLTDHRIAIVTGTAMGRLMPEVLPALSRATGAQYELLALENDLFGPSVTCAGLLPGGAFRTALEGRSDLDLALIPAEALNDDGRFLDDLQFEQLQRAVKTEIRRSYDFADALAREAP